MASLLSDERLCRRAVDGAASLLETCAVGQHVPRVIEIRLGEAVELGHNRFVQIHKLIYRARPDQSGGHPRSSRRKPNSLTLFHNDTFACFAWINEEDPVLLFELISNCLVNFYPARIGRLRVVGFDSDNSPPDNSHQFSKLPLFKG